MRLLHDFVGELEFRFVDSAALLTIAVELETKYFIWRRDIGRLPMPLLSDEPELCGLINLAGAGLMLGIRA